MSVKLSNIKTTTSYEEVKSPGRIFLVGVEKLVFEKKFSTFEIVKQLHPKTGRPVMIASKKLIKDSIESFNYPLIKISLESLSHIRELEFPSFILKLDGCYYFALIPDNINFVNSDLLGAHKCSTGGKICHRLSPAKDEHGGCQKVRDRQKKLENYPWITKGYETINTLHDSFVVAECLHYEKSPSGKKFTLEEIDKI